MTLRRLRAEIAAIERTFPELALPARASSGAASSKAGVDEDANDVSRCA